MANVLWSIIWLIILIIVGFWVAFFCAGWYVLVYPLTVCIPDVAVRIVENMVDRYDLFASFARFFLGHLGFPAEGCPVCALLRQESGRRQRTVLGWC